MLETGGTSPTANAGRIRDTKAASNSVKAGVRALQVERGDAVSLLMLFLLDIRPASYRFYQCTETPTDKMDWFTSVHQRLAQESLV